MYKSLPLIEVMTENNVVAVQVDLSPGVAVRVVSVYLPPLDEIDAELDSLKDARFKQR